MYRSHSPYGQPQSNYTSSVPGAFVPGYPPAPGPSTSMNPGDVIFARLSPPDGSTLYQLFRAMPASVTTPSGVLHGLQWMVAEQVPTPPSGSKPAEADIIDAWQRGAIQPIPGVQAGFPGIPRAPSSTSKSSKDESKRSNRHSRHASDYGDTLTTGRERDGKHSRQSSFSSSTGQPNMTPFPGYATTGGYPMIPGQAPSGYGGYTGYPVDPNAAAAMGPYGTPQPQGYYGMPPTGSSYPGMDLTQKLKDLDLKDDERDKKKKEREKEKESRSRRQSMHESSRPSTTDIYGYPTPGPYGPPGGVYGQPPAGYPTTSPYNPPGTVPFNASPNIRPGEVPYGTPGPGYPMPYGGAPQPNQGGRKSSNSTSSSNQDVWPPGHILEGQPKAPGANTGPPRSKSRAASPNPGSMSMPGGFLQAQPRPSSRMSSHHSSHQGSPNPQLAAPESFSRPINATLPFTYFGPTTIHNMDDLFKQMPKMPQNIESHDVRHEDWFRFAEDLTLAWTGRLPVPPPARDASGNPPRPAVIAAELIHTWNTAFFEPRGIEIVLYKGSQRRSGRLFGRNDLMRNPKEGIDYSSSSTSEESSSDADDSEDPYPRPQRDAYGGRDGYMDELASARRRYHQQKEQEKKERRERRQRKRERRAKRRYIIQAVCIRDGPPKSHSMPPGMVTNSAPGATPLTSAYPGMLSAGMPGAPTSKKSKRQSSGQY